MVRVAVVRSLSRWAGSFLLDGGISPRRSWKKIWSLVTSLLVVAYLFRLWSSLVWREKEDVVDLHGDGRWSNFEKFNLKKLRGLGYRAVSSIIVAGNLERALWFGHDFDLGYGLLVGDWVEGDRGSEDSRDGAKSKCLYENWLHWQLAKYPVCAMWVDSYELRREQFFRCESWWLWKE